MNANLKLITLVSGYSVEPAINTGLITIQYIEDGGMGADRKTAGLATLTRALLSATLFIFFITSYASAQSTSTIHGRVFHKGAQNTVPNVYTLSSNNNFISMIKEGHSDTAFELPEDSYIALQLLDINKDGYTDLAAVGQQTVVWFAGNNTTSLNSETNLLPLSQYADSVISVSSADLNTDGSPELLLGVEKDSQPLLLILDFTDGQTITITALPSTHQIDFLDSGLSDQNHNNTIFQHSTVFAASKAGSISTISQNANELPELLSIAELATPISVMAVADLNDDGTVDAVFGLPEQLVRLINQNDQSFSTAFQNLGSGFLPTHIALGDLDSNELIDAVISVGTLPGLASVQTFRNDGTKFIFSQRFVTGGLPSGIHIANYDLDQDLDVIFTDSANSYIYLLANTSNDSWQNLLSYQGTLSTSVPGKPFAPISLNFGAILGAHISFENTQYPENTSTVFSDTLGNFTIKVPYGRTDISATFPSLVFEKSNTAAFLSESYWIYFEGVREEPDSDDEDPEIIPVPEEPETEQDPTPEQSEENETPDDDPAGDVNAPKEPPFPEVPDSPTPSPIPSPTIINPPTPDMSLLDSDGDGFGDIEEFMIGSSPLDAGSFPPHGLGERYAMWNGFLGMVNVLELPVSRSNESTNTPHTITLYDSSGQAFAPIVIHKPLEQQDVILNSLPGFAPQSYGIAKILSDNAYASNFTVYGEPKETGFSFAASSRLLTPVKTRSTGIVNTYHPDNNGLRSHHYVQNWLSIANTSDKTGTYTIRSFNSEGLLIAERHITLTPFERLDIDANPFPHTSWTGLIEVAPGDEQSRDSSAYIAQIARFGLDQSGSVSFATVTPLVHGNGQRQFSALTNAEDSRVWLEIANANSKHTDVEVTVFNQQGTPVSSSTLHIPAKAHFHLAVSSLIPSGEPGSIEITSNSQESVITHLVTYKRNAYGKTVSAHSTRLRELYGNTSQTSYNTYLDINNTVLLSNTSIQPTSVSLQVGTKAISLTLSPKETLVAPLTPELFTISTNTYGTITMSSDNPRSLIACIIRTRTNSFSVLSQSSSN